MADTRQAIENVKSLARTFQSVIDLAAALENVASIEAALNQASAKLAATRKELDVATDDLITHRNEARRLAAGNADMVGAAKQQVADLVAEAQARAATIVADANARASRINAEADVAVQAAAGKVHTFDATINQRRQELAELESKINRAKAVMADMLKG